MSRYALEFLKAAFLGVAFLSGAVVAQSELKSPAQVRHALGTLNRVVNHTQRLIEAKNYARLPQENSEFNEGIEALQKDIVGESVSLKATVQPLISKSQADSKSVADAATAHDDAKLATTHAAFTDSVKALIAAFPAGVQPSAPGSLSAPQ